MNKDPVKEIEKKDIKRKLNKELVILYGKLAGLILILIGIFLIMIGGFHWALSVLMTLFGYEITFIHTLSLIVVIICFRFFCTVEVKK